MSKKQQKIVPNPKSSSEILNIIPDASKKTSIFSTQTILLLIILGFSFLIYSPCLKNDFVNWDDDRNVYENPNVLELSSKMGLSFFWFKWHQLFS